MEVLNEQAIDKEVLIKQEVVLFIIEALAVATSLCWSTVQLSGGRSDDDRILVHYGLARSHPTRKEGILTTESIAMLTPPVRIITRY